VVWKETLALRERRQARRSTNGLRVECAVALLALALAQSESRIGQTAGQKPRERKRKASEQPCCTWVEVAA
jgi:hypothetical protein